MHYGADITHYVRETIGANARLNLLHASFVDDPREFSLVEETSNVHRPSGHVIMHELRAGWGEGRLRLES